jgi:MFS superfamily sulfate permease-like transporter
MEDLKNHYKDDLLAGFLVFLIALPLSLGIAMASGFPPIAGIFTAIIGGVIVTFFQGSYVTIKGPAAGLIVIVLGSVEALGEGDMMAGYRYTLAVIVVSGVFQVLFGILKVGRFSNFFPSTAVHGMLASIGIIIMSKQFHTILGVKPEAKEPIGLLLEIPRSIGRMNPEVALIGFLGLAILFGYPLIKIPRLQKIPAPLLVLTMAIPMGMYFNFSELHASHIFGKEFSVGPAYLVTLPGNLLDGFQSPDFSKIHTKESILYIFMFTFVGSLETLLSTKAVDILDPQKRKSNLNKDMLAVGVGNTAAGMIGALPMISEIVRSSNNIMNGAKTKWSNFFHGMFLLLFVALFPKLIQNIPLAGLGAMLIFTGFRLASPKVFASIRKIGGEQLIVFVITIIITLSTDLILGILAGIISEFLIEWRLAKRLNVLLKINSEWSHPDSQHHLVTVKGALVFMNYLQFQRSLDEIQKQQSIVVDLKYCSLIDHSVMEHLEEYRDEYIRAGGTFEIKGLESTQGLSNHHLASRIRKG